jgi:hypothetical protein
MKTKLSRQEIVKAWTNLVHANKRSTSDITIMLNDLNEMFAEQYLHVDHKHNIQRNGLGFKFNKSSIGYFKIAIFPMVPIDSNQKGPLKIKFVVQSHSSDRIDADITNYYDIIDFVEEHCNPEFKFMIEKFILENI